MRATRLFTLAATSQALYYVVTGLWPLASMRTFEAITGEKREDWLVQTVGLQLAVAGAAIGLSAGSPSRATGVLALGTAASLAAIDLANVAAGRIRPVYLLDAAAEALLLTGLAAGLVARRTERAEARGGL